MEIAERRTGPATEEILMPTKTISVTREDIRLGVKKLSHRCPIARAIRRICGFQKITVGIVRIAWVLDGKPHNCRLPDKAFKFINQFDAGQIVRPFTFQLRWKK